MSRLVEQDGHLLWTGATSRGHGRIWYNGRLEITHRLYYQLTVGPIPDGLELCHHCEHKHCVRHVAPKTHRENMREDRIRDGTSNRGMKNGSSRLTDTQVDEIRTLREQGESQQAIASRYGLNQCSVSRILTGKRWSHVHPVA